MTTLIGFGIMMPKTGCHRHIVKVIVRDIEFYRQNGRSADITQKDRPAQKRKPITDYQFEGVCHMWLFI